MEQAKTSVYIFKQGKIKTRDRDETFMNLIKM
jgi:hypothetical protein